MGKHAIIIIKNKENKYLQYYDERWQSYLFLNCKINGADDIDIIRKYVEDTLGLKDIKCNYLGMKKHTKFSESAQIEKEYEHYFYKIETNEQLDNLPDNYKWFSYDELKKVFMELTKQANLYEYGKSVLQDTEKMSLNKNILNKKYYLIIPY